MNETSKCLLLALYKKVLLYRPKFLFYFFMVEAEGGLVDNDSKMLLLISHIITLSLMRSMSFHRKQFSRQKILGDTSSFGRQTMIDTWYSHGFYGCIQHFYFISKCRHYPLFQQWKNFNKHFLIDHFHFKHETRMKEKLLN